MGISCRRITLRTRPIPKPGPPPLPPDVVIEVYTLYFGEGEGEGWDAPPSFYYGRGGGGQYGSTGYQNITKGS